MVAVRTHTYVYNILVHQVINQLIMAKENVLATEYDGQKCYKNNNLNLLALNM